MKLMRESNLYQISNKCTMVAMMSQAFESSWGTGMDGAPWSSDFSVVLLGKRSG